VVIVGAPNSGKSSLLNRLAGYDAAIVTPIPGTTRDVLRERISLKGVPIHLVDTAGIRESDDPVEVEGIRRARLEMASADHLLFIFDDSEEQDSHIIQLQAIENHFSGLITSIKNKVDITNRHYGFIESNVGITVGISAKTGGGVDVLVDHLVSSAGVHHASEGLFSARRRHIDALERCALALQRGSDALKTDQAGELLAFELREAQDVLGEITGEFTSDDLLGEIFSSFCIGK
jgi:tRNA modification GTPase